jgi:hypothetical protein
MPALMPTAVVDRHVHSHHVGGPALPERFAGQTRTVEPSQGAHDPDLVLVQHGRRVASERDPVRRLSRHDVSLRHLTSRDVSYRFRR